MQRKRRCSRCFAHHDDGSKTEHFRSELLNFIVFYFSISREPTENRFGCSRALTTFQLGTSVIIELTKFGNVCMPMMQVRFAYSVPRASLHANRRCDSSKRFQRTLRFLLYGRHALANRNQQMDIESCQQYFVWQA